MSSYSLLQFYFTLYNVTVLTLKFTYFNTLKENGSEKKGSILKADHMMPHCVSSIPVCCVSGLYISALSSFIFQVRTAWFIPLIDCLLTCKTCNSLPT